MDAIAFERLGANDSQELFEKIYRLSLDDIRELARSQCENTIKVFNCIGTYAFNDEDLVDPENPSTSNREHVVRELVAAVKNHDWELAEHISLDWTFDKGTLHPALMY
ncbi:hypothetical protein N7457_001473 [Penicillium paradoxum]|uniref:uncharacterized protein n=1 Tax=Penicillium paradoxum TaxID=176176 RepID=UPI002548737B|nr:uncharacterized protein N7457_001473 [Penicillium paradoxum]KAJ5794874.1 hypothetical protein N7457_001473 [Penicillium paradoxum]